MVNTIVRAGNFSVRLKPGQSHTTIKYSPEYQASEINDPNLKFELAEPQRLEIAWFDTVEYHHYKFELEKPINGRYNWYAFQDHVDIYDDEINLVVFPLLDHEYITVPYKGLVLDEYKNLKHTEKTTVDRGLSREEGRKLFEMGILPILQSKDTFMKATAQGQKELDQRGNYLGIKDAPCAYSVSCVIKYVAQTLQLEAVTELFKNPFELDNIRVTGVEKKLRRLGFLYFLKDHNLAPRGAIGARNRDINNVSGHIYFITKDGEKRTKFPNPENWWDDKHGRKEKELKPTDPKWQIKDLHAENLHFFDHVYMQWEYGYTHGFWLPPGIYPLKR